MTRMRKVIYESVLRYLFNSVCTAEVGALEEVRDIYLGSKSVLLASQCPLAQLGA